MVKIIWSRVMAILVILLAPLIYSYLNYRLAIGGFCEVPVVGALALDPSIKGLFLLAIVLITTLVVIKLVLKGQNEQS